VAQLYLLTGEMARVAEALSEAEEVPEALAERLDQLDIELKAKVDGCCRIHQQLLADAAAYQAEARRLAEHAQVATNRANWLKTYMDRCLTEAKVDHLHTGLFKLRFQANPPSVHVERPLDLPMNLQRVTIEPDKKAILQLHRNGFDLPEGVTVIQKTSLRIT
jgi:hypothetical protein